jgi:hypothetical protein
MLDLLARLVSWTLVVTALYYSAYIVIIDPGLRKYWGEKAAQRAARKAAQTARHRPR